LGLAWADQALVWGEAPKQGGVDTRKSPAPLALPTLPDAALKQIGNAPREPLPLIVGVEPHSAEEGDAVDLGRVAMLHHPVEGLLLGDLGRWPAADTEPDPCLLHAFGEMAVAI
jgi:hypothetical protein